MEYEKKFHEKCIYKLQPLYIVNSIVRQSRNYYYDPVWATLARCNSRNRGWKIRKSLETASEAVTTKD